MRTAEFVWTGDLHILGLGFLSAYTEDPDGYIYKALDNVVSYAHEHGIKHMIIPGDVFDNPNPSQEDQKRLLNYLKTTGLTVHMISGNHDVTKDQEHSLIMSEFYADDVKNNVNVYVQPKLIKIDGILFAMLPWPHTQILTKKPCVNIAHITLKNSKGDTGRTIAKGDFIKVLENHHWFIGDLHTKQQYSKRVSYPGMMYSASFGEMGIKGFTHVTATEKNGTLSINEEYVITKPPFELINLQIATVEDLDKIEPYDKKDLKLYKLKITGDIVTPPLLRVDNPHIYDVEYKNGKTIVTKEGVKISTKGVTNPLRGLRTFLIREGATKEEAECGYQYAKAALKTLEGKNQ